MTESFRERAADLGRTAVACGGMTPETLALAAELRGEMAAMCQADQDEAKRLLFVVVRRPFNAGV